MKIALFGQTGQVATEVQRVCPPRVSLDVIGRDRADFSNPERVIDVAQKLEADAVINAVAYTAVDQAEREEDLANCVNGHSVAALAQACAERGVPLVHLSTDYVFPGDGITPWKPDAPTGPLGAYGRSKRLGEEGVQHAGGRHVILRTSWVVSAHGRNFVKTMLRLGAERDHLPVVADQIGGPTGAREIAMAVLSIAEQLRDTPQKSGVYHFAGAPDVSWAEFARAIFVQAGLGCAVEDIPTSAYPTPAERPLNSRLDCHATEAAFGLARPQWHDTLRHIMKDLSVT